MLWIWLGAYFALLPALATCENWRTIKAYKLALCAILLGIATFVITAKIMHFPLA